MSSNQISARQITALAEFRALLRGFLHYSEEAAARAGVRGSRMAWRVEAARCLMRSPTSMDATAPLAVNI